MAEEEIRKHQYDRYYRDGVEHPRGVLEHAEGGACVFYVGEIEHLHVTDLDERNAAHGYEVFHCQELCDLVEDYTCEDDHAVQRVVVYASFFE